MESAKLINQIVFSQEGIKDFILFSPWETDLRQILFLKGEPYFLRNTRIPLSKIEEESEIASLRHYIKRQFNLSNCFLPIILLEQKNDDPQIFHSIDKSIIVQDFLGSVVNTVEKQGLSRFKMLNYNNCIEKPWFLRTKKLMKLMISLIVMGGLLKGGEYLINSNSQARLTPQFQTMKILSSSPSIAPKKVIYLAGILYFNETSWSIWLNNQKISQLGLLKGLPFSLLKVTSKSITLKSNKVGKEELITIKPNQTFIGENNIIKEGDWRR